MSRCARFSARPSGAPVDRPHRSTQRKRPQDDGDERRLTADVVELAKKYGRYGYRRIHRMLGAGWNISLSVVERDWRREGLKVPRKQPRRRRLWLNDGSCIRLRPERPNHVWSYDFVEDVIRSGRKYRMLKIIDEFSRECLAMVPQRRFPSEDVLAVLADLFVERGPPEHIRSDNGPEFAAKAVRRWLARVGVRTLFIEPGSPWEERLHRVVQRAAARRAAQRRALLHAQGGTDHHRAVARALQQGPSAQRTRLPPAGAGRDHPNSDQHCARTTKRRQSTSARRFQGHLSTVRDSRTAGGRV